MTNPDTPSLVPQSRLYAIESMAEIRKSWRMPQFILPTILLPVAFYGLFAIAMSDGGTRTAAYAMATFGVFAAIGPSLFGFGVGAGGGRARRELSFRRDMGVRAGRDRRGCFAKQGAGGTLRD
ncbi:hypothetical protein [Sphingopyxis bauzanensis]|uniref:hypothetical protein n=1 Tax=Sphingopyxis bauzanensis TaxID=651663 RepID=UPI001181BBE2|nr:hypothetical protein [Sphingopyxis bauzanensis]GGJ64854.1 hypothetical protein GCM10011393_38950 [Sphingopyxis bauzanensis]